MDSEKLLKLSSNFLKLCSKHSGAGVLTICSEDNTILLLLRSKDVPEGGSWGIPGGKAEPGEKPAQTARRETIEEINVFPNGKVVDKLVNNSNNKEFTIFIISISLEEKNRLNELIRINFEHKSANWFPVGKMPNNLHSAIEIIRT